MTLETVAGEYLGQIHLNFVILLRNNCEDMFLNQYGLNLRESIEHQKEKGMFKKAVQQGPSYRLLHP